MKIIQILIKSIACK